MSRPSPSNCSPCRNGKCSRKCPSFFYERLRGWPPAQSCKAWIDEVDGPEPYHLTSSKCQPAKRLANDKDVQPRERQ